MKKLTFWAFSAIVLASCEGPEQTQPRSPKEKTLVGTWRTVHEYVRVDTTLPEGDELKPQIEAGRDEIISSFDDSYSLTFEEGGKGFTTGVRTGYLAGRYKYNYTWSVADNEINLVGTADYGGGDGYGGVFMDRYRSAWEKIGWTIDEFTADKLVLTCKHFVFVDTLKDGYLTGWHETINYRYTFTKVE